MITIRTREMRETPRVAKPRTVLIVEGERVPALDMSVTGIAIPPGALPLEEGDTASGTLVLSFRDDRVDVPVEITVVHAGTDRMGCRVAYPMAALRQAVEQFLAEAGEPGEPGEAASPATD